MSTETALIRLAPYEASLRGSASCSPLEPDRRRVTLASFRALDGSGQTAFTRMRPATNLACYRVREIPVTLSRGTSQRSLNPQYCVLFRPTLDSRSSAAQGREVLVWSQRTDCSDEDDTILVRTVFQDVETTVNQSPNSFGLLSFRPGKLKGQCPPSFIIDHEHPLWELSPPPPFKCQDELKSKDSRHQIEPDRYNLRKSGMSTVATTLAFQTGSSVNGKWRVLHPIKDKAEHQTKGKEKQTC